MRHLITDHDRAFFHTPSHIAGVSLVRAQPLMTFLDCGIMQASDDRGGVTAGTDSMEGAWGHRSVHRNQSATIPQAWPNGRTWDVELLYMYSEPAHVLPVLNRHGSCAKATCYPPIMQQATQGIRPACSNPVLPPSHMPRKSFASICNASHCHRCRQSCQASAGAPCLPHAAATAGHDIPACTLASSPSQHALGVNFPQPIP